jgi:hypothetical protein
VPFARQGSNTETLPASGGTREARVAYQIDITRTAADKGVLVYTKDGDKIVDTPCWFDPKVRIPAKTYTGCSATYMARAHPKKADGSYDWNKVADASWKAIFLPDDQTGHIGIFIHRGTDASWSDGCIIIPYSEVEKIWGSITPKDGKNVTVVVTDQGK